MIKFKTYIEQLDISDIFKSQILDYKFINNNPLYYQNYPSLFADAFTVDQSQLDLLDIAGYLYYQATILTDCLIDEKKVEVFSLMSVCQEESVKILIHIFGIDHVFWKLWNSRKMEYFEAVYLEKELFKKEVVAIEEYEALSDKKSAFGKVAIDCLYSLDDYSGSLCRDLHLSHKYFSVAFQLSDDVKDLKEDLVNGQFNWAIHLLKKERISESDPILLEKYLYIRGIAKQIFQLGIEYCEKALKAVKDIDVPKWKDMVTDTKKTFAKAIFEFDNYLEILNTEMSLSNKIVLINTIDQCITNGVEFIKTNQKQNGAWHDYINQGGISTVWSTAFILSKLSEDTALKLIFEYEISRALFFLDGNSVNGLWDYNTNWTEDADSTNFVFLSYLFNEKPIPVELLKKWEQLFQKEEGGFSTYSVHTNILDVLNLSEVTAIEGWLSTHNCVSAVSFYFLANQNQRGDAFRKVKLYFDRKINENLSSYWWTSDIYTYYYLAKVYHLLNDNDKWTFIRNKIKAKQNENGSFSDKYGENLFYTGLALEILLLGVGDNAASPEIKKTIEYLLKNQYEDGSWKGSDSLQLPYTNDIIPADKHFPVGNIGMNVRANEFGRLFTTSTILKSLSKYAHR
ncbi:prenyltransferase/squalene oxidase repeat-containing protein [Flavobacterium poyangense]|uniref:prenyltransferase/squalene oxidase repeat-containing protein n=1 Tax=Flavobacterium poyangense TaxID=2204302 RepID=UPI001421F6AC|nr:prenyltransferase/squalene oxidase repeat-containing protein [Flavobacterium sp. JXAS1]